MDSTVKNKKEAFNHLLERYKKGVSYMDNKEIPLKQRLQWEVEFQKIVDSLGKLVVEIGNVTKEEMTNGFKL